MPATPRIYKTEAVVLRGRKMGEADRILTIYTPGYGKMDAKAKGVRKTMNRMSGHLQPLTRCMLQLVQGHTMEVVTGCETMESFARLREDLELLSRALYAVELLDRMAPERVPGFVTYRLLLDTLRRLVQRADPDLVLRHFEMRLMDQSGFRPELERCVGCGRELQPEENYFAPVAGGTVCRSCVPDVGGSRVLTLNGLKVLRLLQRGSYNDIAGLKAGPALSEEVERHLRSYIVCVLERDVNAAAFIERLRREGYRAAPAPTVPGGQVST